ncbi:hypothetical protein BGZ63DRAFT_454940 [Mariannaea sp. PMI_226]|nr:hypothetical protein BGZ63DRAFT_454940 [Mariannaea sp. PMI_226]
MHIEQLPIELQCSIVQLLEPVGLISISQTNKHFHRLVNPQKKHFIERLLVLECIPKNGGLYPIFRSRDNSLSPEFSDKEWSNMRWLCVGCMKLLSHQYFDNHMILRLGYRKPISGSTILDRISTWSPDPRIIYTSIQKQKQKSPDDIAEEKRLRRRYFISVTSDRSLFNHIELQECGMEGFEGLTFRQFNKMKAVMKQQLLDDNALKIELQRCGSKRHLRKCLECRYIAGQLKPHPGKPGTLGLPIIVSRATRFNSILDRCFPRIDDYLKAKKPPCIPRVHDATSEPHYGRDRLWNLYMFRCPGCTRWKEIREIGKDTFPASPPCLQPAAWTREYLNESVVHEARCHTCYAKANGRQKLVNVLQSWILQLIRSYIYQIRLVLLMDWQIAALNPYRAPGQYRSEVERLRGQAPGFNNGTIKAQFRTLRQYQKSWKDLFDLMKLNHHTNWAHVDLDEWHAEWVRDVNECRRTWRWLRVSYAELKEQPGVLADWALK